MASSIPTFMLPNKPATSDAYADAVTQAKLAYPWLARMPVPIKLFAGKGPYMSESYQADQENNPYPGHFAVELRNAALLKDPSKWPELLGREGIDYLARHDDVYKEVAKQFQNSMTKEQLAAAQRRYDLSPDKEKPSFEDFMREAELQEWIGGYILGEPGWDKAGWTPEQRQMLDNLKNYMYKGQR